MTTFLLVVSYLSGLLIPFIPLMVVFSFSLLPRWWWLGSLLASLFVLLMVAAPVVSVQVTTFCLYFLLSYLGFSFIYALKHSYAFLRRQGSSEDTLHLAVSITAATTNLGGQTGQLNLGQEAIFRQEWQRYFWRCWLFAQWPLGALILSVLCIALIGGSLFQSFSDFLLKDQQLMQHLQQLLKLSGQGEATTLDAQTLQSLESFMADPKRLVREVFISVAGYGIGAYLLVAWLTSLLISSALWLGRNSQGIRPSLISFIGKKMIIPRQLNTEHALPFPFLYGLALAMLFYLLRDQVITEHTDLYSLGALGFDSFYRGLLSIIFVLYLTQGHSIVLYWFERFSFNSLLRTGLMLVTVIFAVWILPLMGILDCWMNWRERPE